MNCSEKFQSLKKTLSSGNKYEKITALREVDFEVATELFDQIVGLTNNHNAEIRFEALRALRFIDPSCLVQIIRDNLHDENKDVRFAASELFHLKDLAA